MLSVFEIEGENTNGIIAHGRAELEDVKQLLRHALLDEKERYTVKVGHIMDRHDGL